MSNRVSTPRKCIVCRVSVDNLSELCEDCYGIFFWVEAEDGYYLDNFGWTEVGTERRFFHSREAASAAGRDMSDGDDGIRFTVYPLPY